MATVKEKIAYAKGLSEGLSAQIQDENVKRLFAVIMDTLDTVADKLEEHDEDLTSIDETIDEMYDEIDEIDEIISECCDDCDCCEDDDDEDYEDDDDYDEDDTDVLGVVCPSCGKKVAVDSDVFRSGAQVECPVCGNVLFTEEK